MMTGVYSGSDLRKMQRFVTILALGEGVLETHISIKTVSCFAAILYNKIKLKCTQYKKIMFHYLKQLIVLFFNRFHERFYDRMKFFRQAAHVNNSASNGSLSTERRKLLLFLN